MDSIFNVVRYNDHESDDTIGPFSTREKAEEAFNKIHPHWRNGFEIVEWYLDCDEPQDWHQKPIEGYAATVKEYKGPTLERLSNVRDLFRPIPSDVKYVTYLYNGELNTAEVVDGITNLKVDKVMVIKEDE